MDSVYTQLARLAMQDPGCRGLCSHAPLPEFLPGLAAEAVTAKRVMLLSGFPVLNKAGEVVCETDGPSGIARLAAAFCALGIDTHVYTGQNCLRAMETALDFCSPKAVLHTLPDRLAPAEADALLAEQAPDLFVSLEIPAESDDGTHRNSRGINIDDRCADGDALLAAGLRAGVTTVAIGDGGNELGMGGLRPLIEAHVRHGTLLCARQSARYILAGGVSNWWGWALAGAMSAAAGKNLMPDPAAEAELALALSAAGCVDGETQSPEGSVDGMPLAFHIGLLTEMCRVVEEALAR